MDERVKFIARMLDGEAMSRLCEEFSISRKTGYNILKRYRDCGVEGLTDRSRRPYRHANQLPLQIETLIVRLKREKPAWGAPKIRERLARLYPDVQRPAISTVHAVLDRHGLVKRRKGRRNKAKGTALSAAVSDNFELKTCFSETIGARPGLHREVHFTFRPVPARPLKPLMNLPPSSAVGHERRFPGVQDDPLSMTAHSQVQPARPDPRDSKRARRNPKPSSASLLMNTASSAVLMRGDADGPLEQPAKGACVLIPHAVHDLIEAQPRSF